MYLSVTMKDIHVKNNILTRTCSTTCSSKYDFTRYELFCKGGLNLFFTNCGCCHFNVTQTLFELKFFANESLDVVNAGVIICLNVFYIDA